jgi:hypothetical protein
MFRASMMSTSRVKPWARIDAKASSVGFSGPETFAEPSGEGAAAQRHLHAATGEDERGGLPGERRNAQRDSDDCRNERDDVHSCERSWR